MQPTTAGTRKRKFTTGVSADRNGVADVPAEIWDFDRPRESGDVTGGCTCALKLRATAPETAASILPGISGQPPGLPDIFHPKKSRPAGRLFLGNVISGLPENTPRTAQKYFSNFGKKSGKFRRDMVYYIQLPENGEVPPPALHGACPGSGARGFRRRI